MFNKPETFVSTSLCFFMFKTMLIRVVLAVYFWMVMIVVSYSYSRVDHMNVVKLFEIFDEKSRLYLVMEL